MAEEIRDPGRNVPRALALGTIAVIIIYALAQHAVSLRDAGRASWRRSRAACSTSSPSACSARAPATSWVSCRSSAWRPSISAMDVRRTARVLRDGARRLVLRRRCAGASEVSRRRPRRSSRRPCGRAMLVLTGSLDALTNYVGFCHHAVRRHRGDGGVRAARARARTRRARTRRSAIPSRPRSSCSPAC